MARVSQRGQRRLREGESQDGFVVLSQFFN
jgi:hypothetical protein